MVVSVSTTRRTRKWRRWQPNPEVRRQELDAIAEFLEQRDQAPAEAEGEADRSDTGDCGRIW